MPVHPIPSSLEDSGYTGSSPFMLQLLFLGYGEFGTNSRNGEMVMARGRILLADFILWLRTGTFGGDTAIDIEKRGN
jgi:hypothetical protein